MRKPVPMFDSTKHKLDAMYQFCSGCGQLFEQNELNTRVTDGVGICDRCASDSKLSKAFNRGLASVAALLVMLIAVPAAHAQTGTTTDDVTQCSTDSNDVTTCYTAPNYAEEARRAENDRRAEQQANRAYWGHIDQLRREGEQQVQGVVKHEKQSKN
jgi:hypothetical protein